jgi:hypothetical protein
VTRIQRAMRNHADRRHGTPARSDGHAQAEAWRDAVFDAADPAAEYDGFAVEVPR